MCNSNAGRIKLGQLNRNMSGFFPIRGFWTSMPGLFLGFIHIRMKEVPVMPFRSLLLAVG